MAAYNEPGTELFNLDQWLERDPSDPLTGGAPQPTGSGMVSICEPCNRYSGTWYVPAFAKLVHAGIEIHQTLESQWNGAGPDTSTDTKAVSVILRQIRPLPAAKEIVAMLLAVNGPEFGKRNRELVDFVLDKERPGIPSKYRLYLTLFAGPLARFVGVSGAIRTGIGASVMTEVAYPPFAYLLTIDSPRELPVGEITEWTRESADTCRDVSVELLVGFGHTPFPADYRSRARIDAEIAERRRESAGIDDA